MGQQVRAGRFANKLKPLAVTRLKKPGMHADGNGLYLAVSDTGAKSWRLILHIGGRRREMGLGSAGFVSLDEAREKATTARKKAYKGFDPIEERKRADEAEAAENASAKTFEEAARSYIESNAPAWRNAKFRLDWPRSLQAYAYPIIGSMQLRHIGKADILRVLEQPVDVEVDGETQTQKMWLGVTETATRVKTRIRLVMDWAAARGYCKTDGHAQMWEDIGNALPKPSKIKKVRHMPAAPYATVADVIKRVRASPSSPLVKAAFEFCVLTAVRSRELRFTRWGEIDLDRKTWTLPEEQDRTKSNRQLRVPLSDRAVEILRSVLHPNGSQPTREALVFDRGDGKPISDQTHLMLLRRLKVASDTPGRFATLHGFRSSFRDWAGEESYTPADIIEAALAHKLGGATQEAYQRGDLFEKRRKLMDEWAVYCAGVK